MKLPICIFLILCVLSWARAADDPFQPLPPQTTGLVRPDVALFIPQEMNLVDTQPSLALLERPAMSSPLPSTWSLIPRFSRTPTQTRATLSLPADTSLYGEGEVTGPLLRNGTKIVLWNTDTPAYGVDGGRRLYQSHPWILGVRTDGTAFGFLADTTWRSEIDLTGGDIVFTSDGPLFQVLVIQGDSPQAVLKSLASLIGKMELPPRWALGYQQSRWSYHPEAEVRDIASGFRSRKIPCDVIWMDIHYMDGYRVFTFNPAEFMNPAQLNGYLHASGFKSVWMIDPGVKAEPGFAIYDSGTAQNVWVKTTAGANFEGNVWPGRCVFPDFTRPETRAWWASLYHDFLATGLDGVWNDMNEPSVFDGPAQTMPVDCIHRGGGGLPEGPHLRYHNVYGLLMVKASRDGILAANPDKRPFILTRSNFLGGQRYAATWTGDNASTWEHLRMSIPMSLTLGLSGQPFSGPDIGGFGGEADAGLWGQWIAIGAFFPFARAHSAFDTGRKEPWAFGPEVENAARIALERRYRLLPYLYTCFHQSSLDGLPIMRPAFLADPKDPSLRAEEQIFLLGADLLVVPKWAQQPHLPSGLWRTISLVGEESARDSYQVDLKIRAGSILPLGKVVQSTVEDSLDPLTLLVCLDEGGTAEGALYEDDGDGFAYRHGDYLLTTYRAEKKEGQIAVQILKSEGQRPRPSRVVKVQIITDTGLLFGEGDETAGISIPLP